MKKLVGNETAMYWQAKAILINCKGPFVEIFQIMDRRSDRTGRLIACKYGRAGTSVRLGIFSEASREMLTRCLPPMPSL